MHLESVVREFQVDGNVISIEPYGNGHINATYQVILDRGGQTVRYILQRISSIVFPDTPALMDNLVRVTDHIRNQLQQKGASDITRRVLTVVATNDGTFHRDTEGADWRMFLFIENAHAYETVPSGSVIYEAARAFGEFASQLRNLPGPPLHTVLPDFHNGIKRFRDFQEALDRDPENRAIQAKKEIRLVSQFTLILDIFPALLKNGRLPVRIVHNDTKINNVLLDDGTEKGLCVIDLDTVMEGLAAYDFGDLMRTVLSSTAEDESDLEKIGLNLDHFTALKNGYLAGAGHFLTQAERENLVNGGKLITLLMGIRFLTDFLNGDLYYHIHYPDHNLRRCRTQFQLLKLMLQCEEEMQNQVMSES